MTSTISVHDQFAADYDRQVRKYHCYAADVLFGLCREYAQPGERLLDLGIGTGLSAVLFARTGLEIFGADVSPEMLEICRSKKLAVELRQFDLQDTPWLYANASFNHVISCGVFHFVEDLEPVFQEVARVLCTNGIFGFTVKAPPEESAGTVQETTEKVTVFMHPREYIERCAASHQFEILKELRFFIGNREDPYSELFDAFVLRKTAR